jgi:hypothetical protein
LLRRKRLGVMHNGAMFRAAQRICHSFLCVACMLAPLMFPAKAAQNLPTSWLDRPLAGWNGPAAPVPAAPQADETIAAVISRCKLSPPRSTPGERAVEAAGWIPFWNFDQQLVREDVEIVGGMRAADAMCLPAAYQLFVFVGGRFAGMLSPGPMNTNRDSSAGVVRLPLPAVTADFARFAATDAVCCPSSRVTVSYRIDRTPTGPVVVPVEVRATRR